MEQGSSSGAAELVEAWPVEGPPVCGIAKDLNKFRCLPLPTKLVEAYNYRIFTYLASINKFDIVEEIFGPWYACARIPWSRRMILLMSNW
jgi:hypothetical protein